MIPNLDSGLEDATYQNYAFSLSIWALNILVMIISLTCLLISDPMIYSDSETYQEYVKMRKQAEDNLNKVSKKYFCYYNSLFFQIHPGKQKNCSS